MTVPEASGGPTSAELTRAAVVMLAAGRRRDMATSTRTLNSLMPPYVADQADARLGGATLTGLVAALVAIAGDLLRSDDPAGRLALFLTSPEG